LPSGLPARALEIARLTGPFENEGWPVRKDGTQFLAYVVIDPIRSPSGDVIGYAKITRDLAVAWLFGDDRMGCGDQNISIAKRPLPLLFKIEGTFFGKGCMLSGRRSA
jgi:hypothetical protein